ncbi:MAG: hypothetical protein ABJ375_01830 [Rhizobiaceae bacterium]
MSGRFSEKLNSLPATIQLCREVQVSGLANEIQCGQDLPAVLVGSGGSAISAQFFCYCRETQSHGPSIIETPMQFSSAVSGLNGYSVWLFSAGAENADALAAVESAFQRGASHVNMITRNPDGRAAKTLHRRGGNVFSVPVAEIKDSFLATHSLIATVTVLLRAFDELTDAPLGDDIVERLLLAANIELEERSRAAWADAFSSLSFNDTLMVIAEPELIPVAELLETSVWESAICNVQTADFRNFAHGRHTWLHHRAGKTFILSLVGQRASSASSAILELIPAEIRGLTVEFGNCGRFEVALGIVRGLTIIEAMGKAVGIDPGKPGVGSFGREIYDSDALLQETRLSNSTIRHKYAAVLKQDRPGSSLKQISGAFEQRRASLSKMRVGGIVLDYDGTVVSTKDRCLPPRDDIVSELRRMSRLGLRIAFATGRGGSAGEVLRQIFEEGIHRDIIIGYYNGGYLKSLDVDIDVERPNPNAALDQAIEWMSANPDLFVSFVRPKSGVQVSIQKSNLRSAQAFVDAVSTLPALLDRRLRLDSSAHSYDLVIAEASKQHVVRAVASEITDGSSVLCLGDSGTIFGNDHELLSHPSGISVDAVCCDSQGSWTLFGHEKSGPDALLEILSSLDLSEDGDVELKLDDVKLDTWR